MFREEKNKCLEKKKINVQRRKKIIMFREEKK